MSIKKLLNMKPIQAASLMLLVVFVSGQVASATTCKIYDSKTNTKCTVNMIQPVKLNNEAYSATMVTCNKVANISINANLQQLSILGRWSVVQKENRVVNAKTSLVDFGPHCRYGTVSSWRAHSIIMINGRNSLNWTTAGVHGNALKCSI